MNASRLCKSFQDLSKENRVLVKHEKVNGANKQQNKHVRKATNGSEGISDGFPMRILL